MGDEHRLKIANGNILNRLIKHANGEVEMSASQVDAAKALLKKVMPDLASMQISGPDEGPVEVDVNVKNAASVLTRKLDTIAKRSGTGSE